MPRHPGSWLTRWPPAGSRVLSGASDRSSSEELTALETARSVVLVLSAAANAAPDVVRELERAAARGIPIIPYATEDVSPSPSIAYFTATVPPIPAWSGDRQRMRASLVEAVKRALTASVATPARSASHGTRYSRASYADARGLQIGVGILLVISAVCERVRVLSRRGLPVERLRGEQSTPAVTAQRPSGLDGDRVLVGRMGSDRQRDPGVRSRTTESVVVLQGRPDHQQRDRVAADRPDRERSLAAENCARSEGRQRCRRNQG